MATEGPTPTTAQADFLAFADETIRSGRLPGSKGRSPRDPADPAQPTGPKADKKPWKPVKQRPEPPRPEVPEGLTAEEEEQFLRAKGYAHKLQHDMAGFYLYASLDQPIAGAVPPESPVMAVDDILKQAGSPADPVERMLVEQLVLAHHALGRIHMEANRATSAEEAEIYNNSAARLLGEFRRTAIALKSYREPSPSRPTVIHQQNLASGDQNVALVQGGAAAEKKDPKAKLTKPKELEHVVPTHFVAGSECPKPKGRKQPAKAKKKTVDTQ